MTFPTIDIGSYVTSALAWAVPMVALLFAASWGVRLIFGRRRQSLPTLQVCLLEFSQLVTPGALGDLLLILGWLTAFVFVMAFITWLFKLVFGGG